MPHRHRWTLADVLDFEALLHLDAQGDPAALRERDAAIWREKIAKELPVAEHNERGSVFRRWLEARRAAAGTAPLPGTWLVSGWRAFGGVAATLGAISGFGVATAALYYSGERPVNVAVFLAATVFVQWLLLFWLLLIAAFQGFRQAAGRALVRFADTVGRWLAGLLDHLPGDQRMRVQGEAAALKNLAGRNGALLGWPPILGLQAFGVTWNLGVLVALVLRVTFTDVAFGWESTWAKGPEPAHSMVQALAAPWLWLFPDGCPTLTQVEHSWFHFQSGVAALDKVATRSWFPWLVGMIIVYGLSVRLAVLAWAGSRLRTALREVDFHEPRHLEAWLRLDGRVIQAEAVTPDAEIEPGAEATPLVQAEAAPGCVLIDRSLGEAQEAIVRWVNAKLGWKVTYSAVVEADFPGGNDVVIGELTKALPESPRWLVVMPAPFTSFAAFGQFLESLHQAEPAAGKVERGIILAGRGANGAPEAPSADWVKYWRDFLRTEHRDVAVIDWNVA